MSPHLHSNLYSNKRFGFHLFGLPFPLNIIFLSCFKHPLSQCEKSHSVDLEQGAWQRLPFSLKKEDEGLEQTVLQSGSWPWIVAVGKKLSMETWQRHQTGMKWIPWWRQLLGKQLVLCLLWMQRWTPNSSSDASCCFKVDNIVCAFVISFLFQSYYVTCAFTVASFQVHSLFYIIFLNTPTFFFFLFLISHSPTINLRQNQ